MAWEDEAPILSSLGVTQGQTVTFFENHTPDPAPSVPPVITQADVVAIANIMFDGVNRNGIRINGGIVKIAQNRGLTVSQVTAIVKEIKHLYSLWLEQQD